MDRVITRALLVMLLVAASAAGYQWASRYDGHGHGPDTTVGLVLKNGLLHAAGTSVNSDHSRGFQVLKLGPAAEGHEASAANRA